LPEVRIEQLAKRFGATVAVDEMSFTVEEASGRASLRAGIR
jgi:ABC-type branched-subunit amino acid transport system ATPase component